MREESLGQRLGQILQDSYIPDDVLAALQEGLTASQRSAETGTKQWREKLQAAAEHHPASPRSDIHGQAGRQSVGRILATQDRRWQMEEQQVLVARQGLALITQ